jgi:hypothetical protein
MLASLLKIAQKMQQIFQSRNYTKVFSPLSIYASSPQIPFFEGSLDVGTNSIKFVKS